MCGGTEEDVKQWTPPKGLSPRVRGNPKENSDENHRPWSIPACAGEPDAAARCYRAGEVYPRVCGGTLGVVTMALFVPGLSPRVRGNRPGQAGAGVESRSIPACAGEPVRCSKHNWNRTVYPRVCGGTGGGTACPSQPEGLSPRVRGNHGGVLQDTLMRGSIPACAGEPRKSGRGRRFCVVYPRVCGGTGNNDVLEGLAGGLSPRVRGNRRAGRRRCVRAGSIPACAGEPMPAALVRSGGWVYPRVCGGTRR